MVTMGARTTLMGGTITGLIIGLALVGMGSYFIMFYRDFETDPHLDFNIYLIQGKTIIKLYYVAIYLENKMVSFFRSD